MSEDVQQGWGSAIVDFDPTVDPSNLVAHELNARRHPVNQRDAIRGALGTVGWVDTVKVNTRTGKIMDGHARVEEALEAGETVPVLWLDLDEEQERYVLATFDPIGTLATTDMESLDDLLNGLQVNNAAIDEMLHQLSISAAINVLPDEAPFSPTLNPTLENRQFQEGDMAKAKDSLEQRFEHTPQQLREIMCPNCGSEFYID